MIPIKKDKHNIAYKRDRNKLDKSQLLPHEYEQYRQFGKPDLSQDWLEVFSPTMISDLFEIMRSCSNNQKKAGYIKKELAYHSFYEVGEGTNVYTMANPLYPGVVFKIALDDYGLADNFNDCILEGLVNEMLGTDRYTHTLARHPSGIISVQERKVIIQSQDRMDDFRGSIMKTLEKLSQKFLIVDLSPNHYHLNYGIDRNGDWCFVDASDLYPLENYKGPVRCNKAIGWSEKRHEVKRCGGGLMYNSDFSNLVCAECGSEYMPSEFRPRDKEGDAKMANSTCDGMSAEARKELISEEVSAVLERKKFLHHTTVNSQYGATGSTPFYDKFAGNEETGETAGKDDENVDTTPPTKEHPRTIFVDTSKPDPEPPEPDDDDEDDEVSVEESTVAEPDEDTIREHSTSFAPPSEPDEDGDDDEEEDAEGSVELLMRGDTVITTPPVPAEATEATPAPSPAEEDTQPENRIHYTVMNVDEAEVAGDAGICLEIHGDFDKAYEDYGLPVFVRFVDKGRPFTQQLMSSDTMKRIIDTVMPDILEEVNASCSE